MQNRLIEFNWRDEPAIAGTDITVAHILERFSREESFEDICSRCRLTKEQVQAALSFAAANLPHGGLDATLHAILRDTTPQEEELDYGLLSAYMS